ncbi:MAG TPA: hypothetical protein PK250_18845 [Syntrophobacter fumaroxidans]|nr:hypothetical protein [Syntrophobacter fumaroxidans]
MPEIDTINNALLILAALSIPRTQQSERSALCLLTLLDLTPDKAVSARRMAPCRSPTGLP